MAFYDKKKEQLSELGKPPLISEWKDYFQQGFKIFSRNNDIRDKVELSLLPPVEIKIDDANDFSFKEEGEIQNRLEKEIGKKIFDLNSIEVKESETYKDFSPIKDSKDFKDFKELKESKDINEINEISFANNRFSFEDVKPHITEAKKMIFSLSNISMSNSFSNLNNINDAKSIEVDKLTENKENNENDSLAGFKMNNEKNPIVESIEIDPKIDLASNDVINEVFQNKYTNKNKDREIKNLEDKLSAYKYQNKIMLEENNKLLEIINLFKILQNMEKENETLPTVKNEKENESVTTEKRTEYVQTDIDVKNEIEKQPTRQLLETTKVTGVEVIPAAKKIEEKKVHPVEMDRIINYSLYGANANTNSNLIKEVTKASNNIIVGNENICIKGDVSKFTNLSDTNSKLPASKENQIENLNEICNVATILPMIQEAPKNIQTANSIPDRTNVDKTKEINSNYLSFKDFPDNTVKEECTPGKLAPKGKKFIETVKVKKNSYGKIYQNLVKANEKEMAKNKTPLQSQVESNIIKR